jgi:hypothetical protein
VRAEIVFVELSGFFGVPYKTVRLKPPLLLAEAVLDVPTAAKARSDEMNALRRSMVGYFE